MNDFDTLIAQFGAAAKARLNGPGEPEAALATPVDNLIREYGEKILNRKIVLHAEVREDAGNVRPDFGVRIIGTVGDAYDNGLMESTIGLYKSELIDFEDGTWTDLGEVERATWRRATGAPFGPFEIYDFVGIQTPYHLNAHNPDEEMQEFAKILKRDLIDKKQLGRGSGKGFYEYD